MLVTSPWRIERFRDRLAQVELPAAGSPDRAARVAYRGSTS